VKHEIAVIAYDIDMSILFVVFNQFDTICFQVFFMLHVIKLSAHRKMAFKHEKKNLYLILFFYYTKRLIEVSGVCFFIVYIYKSINFIYLCGVFVFYLIK